SCLYPTYCSFSLLLPPPPLSTLFPYTTLFRSPVFSVPENYFENFTVATNHKQPAKVVGMFSRKIMRYAAAAVITGAIAITGLLIDRKSTRLNSSHSQISYAVFCLKKKNIKRDPAAGLSYGARHAIRSALQQNDRAALAASRYPAVVRSPQVQLVCSEPSNRVTGIG